MKEQPRKRCALYLRVSTEHQAENYSLRTQRALLVRHARDCDYEVVDIYRDVGLSGKNTKRPELSRLRADARQRRFDLVLVWKVDRISRSLKDLILLVRELDDHGVEFATVDQEFDTKDAAGRLTMQVLGSFAQFERELLVERTREGQLQRVKSRDWSCGPVPFGFRKVDGRLVEEPVEAKVVRRMFRMFLELESLRGVATRLNEEGIRTRRGNLWNGFTVKQLLINPVYTGANVYGRHAKGDTRIKPREEWVVVQGMRPPLVDVDVFQRIQEVITGRRRNQPKRRPALEYPLSGKLPCKECGGPMYGSTARKPDGRVYRYYKCYNRLHKGKTACTGMSVRAEEAEGKRIRQKAGRSARKPANRGDLCSDMA